MTVNLNLIQAARVGVAMLEQFGTTHLRATDLRRDLRLSQAMLPLTRRRGPRMLASQVQTLEADAADDIILMVDRLGHEARMR